MDIPQLLFGVIVALIIFDLCFWGTIPYLLKIYPTYHELLSEGVLLKDKTGKWDKSIGGDRFKELILTPKFLIFKNNYFTSALNLSISHIKNYSVDKSLAGKSKLILHISQNGKIVKYSFVTSKLDEWRNNLNQLKINENA